MSERARPLRRRDLDPDPLRQFDRWYDEAGRVVDFPEAVALATASPSGQPSARMVLAKRVDERGFRFHTGYSSRKAGELEATGSGALLLLASARPPGADRGAGPAGLRRRVRGVLPDSAAGRADRRLGLGPERGDRIARAARGEGSGARAGVRGSRRPSPATLGRLPARAGGLGILAAPREPPARSLPLPPGRRRLGH